MAKEARLSVASGTKKFNLRFGPRDFCPQIRQPARQIDNFLVELFEFDQACDKRRLGFLHLIYSGFALEFTQS